MYMAYNMQLKSSDSVWERAHELFLYALFAWSISFYSCLKWSYLCNNGAAAVTPQRYELSYLRGSVANQQFYVI